MTIETNKEHTTGYIALPAAMKMAGEYIDDKGKQQLRRLAENLIARSLDPVVDHLLDELPELSAKQEEKIENSRSLHDPEVEKVTAQLKELRKQPGALEEFVLQYAESLYLRGGLRPGKVTTDTYEYLQEIGKQVVSFRELEPKQCAPKETKRIEGIKALQDKMLSWIEGRKLSSHDYVAIRAQYQELSRVVTAEQSQILNTLPQKEMESLEQLQLKPQKANKGVNDISSDLLKKLLRAGIVNRFRLPDTKIMVYSCCLSKFNSEKYEKLIPTTLLEKLSDAVTLECKTKYSGKYVPLGYSDTDNSEIDLLRDQIRIDAIAHNAGVSEHLVRTHLTYLLQHRLLEEKDGGFVFSKLGDNVGVGIRGVGFAQQAAKGEVEGEQPVILSIEKYLDAVHTFKDSMKMRHYSFTTQEGECPLTYLLDELYAGNARVEPNIIRAVIEDIKSQKNALVIASNMFQGKPEVEPRSMRTSLPPELTGGVDLREYKNQIPFVKNLLEELEQPTLLVFGKNDIETANCKTDDQRERDKQALKGQEKLDEETIASHRSHKNLISERAGRKYNAKLQAEILQFVSDVVMPFEFKIGRELMSSKEVHARTGLNINELEILRDIAGRLHEDKQNQTSEGRSKVRERYKDFLKLEEVDEHYLLKLEHVLFDLERLTPSDPVACNGARITFRGKDGREGLQMMTLPEARFGVSEAMNPTTKLIETLKSKVLKGEDVPDIVCVGATGQPFFSTLSCGTAIIAADTWQSSDMGDRYVYTEAGDRHKRRRMVRGGESSAGTIAFSGGVDDGIATRAYDLRIWNSKIQKQLEENAKAEMPKREIDIYATSDLQLGSPTAKPATFLRGLFHAVATGHKHILLNGDMIQGMNYMRFPAEAQTTGIIGIEDQQAFFYDLLTPVLDYIKEERLRDPEWELPTWYITAGNHETNSQANKGLQGIWFLHPVAGQVESFYRGAFGEDASQNKVLYPKKFVDRENTDIDYSHLMLDFSDETGFRIGAQHYVGIGAKGSKATPPIQAAKTWLRSMENQMRSVHGLLLGHWHTQSVTQADGVFSAIFGANAAQSGFEWHLGYPTTVPASGSVRLYSHKAPELKFLTDPYLRVKEEVIVEQIPQYQKLMNQHGCLEEAVEQIRASHQRRDVRAFNYTEHKAAMDTMIDPHRRVA